MDMPILRHESAVWEHLADSHALLPREEIPAQGVVEDDGLALRLCAIPVAHHSLALGDVVRVHLGTVEVLRRSGHGTIHLSFSDSFGPREEILERLTGLGALMEHFDENFVVVDVSPSIADAVMAYVKELKTQGQIDCIVAQTAAPLIDHLAQSRIVAGVADILEELAGILETEAAEKCLQAIQRGQAVLSVEKLSWALGDQGVHLTQAQHRTYAGLMDAAGLPWELSPSYQIDTHDTDVRHLSHVHSELVRALGEWGDVEVTTSTGLCHRLLVPAVQTDAGTATVVSAEGQLFIVGAQTATRQGDSLIISGFQFAHLVHPRSAWASKCDVLLEGEITLHPTSNRQGMAEAPRLSHEEKWLKPQFSSAQGRGSRGALHEVLSREGNLRILATKPPVWPKTGVFLIGVFLTWWALTVGPESESNGPVFLLLAGIVLMIAAPVVRRRQLRTSEVTMRAIGTIGAGHIVQGLARNLAVEAIIPQEWSEHETARVLDAIHGALDVAGAPKRWRRAIGIAVVRCRTARSVDAALPPGIALRQRSAHVTGGQIYALVSHPRGHRIDVLEVKQHVLREVGHD